MNASLFLNLLGHVALICCTGGTLAVGIMLIGTSLASPFAPSNAHKDSK